jgi:ion channel-forming bestrophin family protein
VIDYDAKSWFGTVVKLKGSVIPALIGRILLCAGIGAAAASLFDTRGVRLPSIAHTLLGLALGLLLVFRTNASYDRYWEGRKLLGAMVNRSRDLVRQASSFIDGQDPDARSARAEVRRLVVVLYALIRQYLRKERDLGALGAPLSAAERDALNDVAVRPVLAVHWISERLMENLRAGRLSEERLQLLDANVTAIVDYWGGAERIMKTPIPFAYAQHIKSFLTLFCLTAPFAMVESMRWHTPIAAAVLAFGMFGIDEIGVEIEDPFGHDANDLPLDAIGARIDEDTAVIVRHRDSEAKAHAA